MVCGRGRRRSKGDFLGRFGLSRSPHCPLPRVRAGQGGPSPVLDLHARSLQPGTSIGFGRAWSRPGPLTVPSTEEPKDRASIYAGLALTSLLSSHLLPCKGVKHRSQCWDGGSQSCWGAVCITPGSTDYPAVGLAWSTSCDLGTGSISRMENGSRLPCAFQKTRSVQGFPHCPCSSHVSRSRGGLKFPRQQEGLGCSTHPGGLGFNTGPA
jgi:hypothetical protein